MRHVNDERKGLTHNF